MSERQRSRSISTCLNLKRIAFSDMSIFFIFYPVDVRKILRPAGQIL